jgi:ectoine hydroxylase-related dioxygenase (phytanoyl-CoA dioxygenase family)
LGDDAQRRNKVQILEVDGVSDLAPQPRETQFFRQAFSTTQQLLGGGVELLYDHCIIKPPMNHKETAWHQDCAYFRRRMETRRRLHWWLPLQDVTRTNGCMQFVRGSHRGRTLPHVPVTERAHSLCTDLPKGADVICCPLRVGGVTIHLAKTLHRTGANETADPRMAWIVHLGLRGFSRLVPSPLKGLL